MAGTKEQIEEPAELGLWLAWRLRSTGRMQKWLAAESGLSTATISELISGKQKITAETAEKLAGVPDLKTTSAALLRRGGAWQESHPTRRRDVAQTLFDKLSVVEQDLTIDFTVMLAKRERESNRD